MKKWAKLDEDGIVEEIIIEKEDEDRHPNIAVGTKSSAMKVEEKQGLVRTFDEGEGPKGSYASVGFKYDRDLKGFVPPRTDETDVFDAKRFQWLPAKPDEENEYVWDEGRQAWLPVE